MDSGHTLLMGKMGASAGHCLSCSQVLVVGAQARNLVAVGSRVVLESGPWQLGAISVTTYEGLPDATALLGLNS